jgi:HK97 family phage prohead protease
MSNKREFRHIPAKELRVANDNGKRTLSGYAVVFNSLSEDLGGWREQIMPTAFDKCLSGNPDIVCLRDHVPSLLLGRTKSGTLRVSKNDVGILFECDLPDTQLAQDTMTAIERGDLDGCSFGMYCLSDDWKNDAGVTVRSVVEADMFDVSVVTYPAYQATSVGLRSLFPDGEVKAPEPEAPAQPEKRTNANGCDCECPECMDDDCENCSEPDCTDPNCEQAIRSRIQIQLKVAENL